MVKEISAYVILNMYIITLGFLSMSFLKKCMSWIRMCQNYGSKNTAGYFKNVGKRIKQKCLRQNQKLKSP